MFCKIYPKSCTRCGGDLSLEQDSYGVYLTCIQCGAVVDKLPAPTGTSVNIRVLNGHTRKPGEQLAVGGKHSRR